MIDRQPSFRDRLLGNVCQYDYLMYILVVLQILLLLLALLSYLFADLNAETRTILLIDFVLLGMLFAGTVFVIKVCGSYRGGA